MTTPGQASEYHGSERRADRGKWLRRALIVWACIVSLALVVVGDTLRDRASANRKIAIENRRLALEGKTAHDALCIGKGQRIRDLARTRSYRDEHPQGVKDFITRAQLDQAIVDAQEDIRALRVVKNCAPHLLKPPKKDKPTRPRTTSTIG